MITKIGKEECLEYAAELLKMGEIVAFPTETVYGLGGDALNVNAISKIYEAKNRPKDNPFIVHVYDIEAADRVAYVTKEAEKVLKEFSPGPLTVVLKKRACVPDSATAGLDTVGIRIPSHPMCRELLRLCDIPIAAPSANLSKKVSPTSAEYVYEDMKGRIPLILDGGRCDVGIESTVISLAGTPTILRPGIITEEKLLKVLDNVEVFRGEVKVAPAPGMKYKHYAPTVPCVMFSSDPAAVKKYDEIKENGRKPVILCKGDASRFCGRDAVSMGKDGMEIARNVFFLMREAEKTYDFILIEMLSYKGEEGSVMNRISKSCEGNII